MSRTEDEKSLHFTTFPRTTHSLYPRASMGYGNTSIIKCDKLFMIHLGIDIVKPGFSKW